MKNVILILTGSFFLFSCNPEVDDKSKMQFRDKLTYVLKFDENGTHSFGGEADHKGVFPEGSKIPLHKILTIDLKDTILPIKHKGFSKIPLYYPLKYGFGGPSVQCKLINDSEIKIIYISDPKPDDEEPTYVKVDHFPSFKLKSLPGISNDEDIDWFTITVAGKETLDHKADSCQNKECKYFSKEPNTHLIASIPPLEIPGHKEIWYEFEGAYMLFYFWYCKGCDSIIASNRAT